MGFELILVFITDEITQEKAFKANKSQAGPFGPTTGTPQQRVESLSLLWGVETKARRASEERGKQNSLMFEAEL